MSDSVRPGTALDQLLERCAQLRQPRRLAEHAIDVIRQFAFTPYAVSPTGEENDGRVRGRALDRRGNGPAIDVRHSEIRDYRLEALALLACRRELIDAPLAAVDGEPQARAPLAFGREEGLETAASDRLGHAHTRVADLDLNLRRGARFAVGAVTDARAQRERAALRHGIDRVQNQVSERVADLALGSHDTGQIGCEIRLQVDDDSPLLRYVAPARAREPRDLLQQI